MSQSIDKQSDGLKKVGKIFLGFLCILFWYLSIPSIIIWYLYKRNKSLTSRTKLIISIVAVISFPSLLAIMNRPTMEPVLILSEPASGVTVQKESVTVKGKVTPKGSIVTIDGVVAQVDKGNFSYEVKLHSESNTINIEATNKDKKMIKSINIQRVFTEEELANKKKSEDDARLAKKEDIKQKIQKEIDSVKTFNNSIYRGSVSAMQLELAVFSSYATVIKTYRNNTESEIKALVSELERKVSQLQISEFPKMRKAYADMISKQLWEQNITVTSGGAGNKSLTFTASIFANNKNIQTVHSSTEKVMDLFRFTQANYKWYKYDEEYTYFTLESHKDSEVVEIGK